jgi:3'(2'), 5'-bisphosphate nucleotidase
MNVGDSPSEALRRLCGIARDAGVEVMRTYRTGLEVTHKHDSSPLTAADLASQDVIVRALRSWQPDIPIIAEESRAPDATARARWDRWWLVDPLDGTKEFLSGNGEFTVNIALMQAGQPVLGVVHAPALDLLYWAGCRLGAWRQEGRSAAVRIQSGVWRRGQPARIVESRSHPSAELDAFLQSVEVIERIPLGSSLKFCRVAEGGADLYPRFGPMMEWDVAAGDCIFRNSAAVGERPSPLRYNTTDLRVPGFVLGQDDRR